MNSKDKYPTSPKKNLSKKNSIITENDDILQPIPENPNPIKPIAINRKLIINTLNENPIHPSSSMSLSNFTPKSDIPIIYPQFQLCCLPERNNKLNSDFSNFIPNNGKIDKNDNYSIIDSQNQTQPKENNKYCCSCTKTKCIKKYCECFANKRLCINCHCQDCRNNNTYNINANNNYNNIVINEKIEKIICTCTKSSCNKKYCECYKAGVSCNNKCRCVNCKNVGEMVCKDKKRENTNINIDENLSLDEEKSNSEKFKNNNEESEDEESFKIERINVYINKTQTYINTERLGKAEMKLLCKKKKKGL